MKRFLSLVLSALFVFQLGIACDAASHYRSSVQNYGQGQPMVMIQPSLNTPQKEPVVNVTVQEAPPAPINVHNQPEINVKRVDATTWGDKFAGVLKCVFWLLLSGVAVGVVATLSNFGFGVFGKFDSWVEKKIYSLIAYLSGGEEQLEKKSKNFLISLMGGGSQLKQEEKCFIKTRFGNFICF